VRMSLESLLQGDTASVVLPLLLLFCVFGVGRLSIWLHNCV